MAYRIDLKELAEELDDLRARKDDAESFDSDVTEHLDDEETARLAALEELESDLGGDLHVASRDYSPIHEDDFEDYARDLAVDLSIIEGRYLCYFDGEAWASDLRQDYSSFDFDGDTYYYQG